MPPRTNNHKSGPPSREVQVSKKLSWLLRHGAEKEGLTLNSDGYINLADVLANRNIKSLKITFDEVQQIVQDNDKQRFNLVPDPSKTSTADHAPTTPTTEPSHWLIRANQGHSIKVDDEGSLLTAVTPDNLPATVVHGTTHANWIKIVESGGLKPMKRNHVHFASGLPTGFETLTEHNATNTAAPVISGMRSSSTIIIYLDIVKAMDAGIAFGLSQNGVILTTGNVEGLVPLSFFSRVEDRTGEGVLLEHGTVVKEAPSTWAKKVRHTS